MTSGHHGSIRTTSILNNSTTKKTCNRTYTWLPLLLLPPSGYSIWGTENRNWMVMSQVFCADALFIFKGFNVIKLISNNSTTKKTCNRKYTWQPFGLLPHREYSLRGTENWNWMVMSQVDCADVPFVFKGLHAIKHHERCIAGFLKVCTLIEYSI